jgi:hypothetical protein
MHHISRALAWLERAVTSPRGRHHRCHPTRTPLVRTPRQKIDLLPAPDPIRMDDSADPRRYALPRPPFRRWEEARERTREFDELAVLLRGALALGIGR